MEVHLCVERFFVYLFIYLFLILLDSCFYPGDLDSPSGQKQKKHLRL